MNLHEYQSKIILKHYGVSVPEGLVAHTEEEAVKAAEYLQGSTGSDKFVIKAQVHAGGRGKGGGVKVAKTIDEVRTLASQIIGMHLVTPQTSKEGKLVRKVYVEQNIYYPGPSEPAEIYMSILLNRQKGHTILMYSPRGGMDIEKVAEETPEQIFTETVDPKIGLQVFQARKVAFNLGLKEEAYKNMVRFVTAVYKAYEGSDASLIEINPVFKTSDNKILAADAKVVIDNNALFRHPDIAAMRDFDEEDPVEVEATRHDLNYVKLNGNVGCMVNGAGLAMATMDIIKLSGGDPANFLDVGGSANAKRVEEGFRIILKDPAVKAILVNIFGGIVRCDRVAQGIVEAYKNIGEINVPLIVRLQGTNAVEGKKLIDDSGLKVHSAITLQDAARLVTQVLN
ncbi:MAG: ADP-forming succinate--CoA ligase subunit beta [Bacteroidales bacterium]|nr:ADP-forming succinate--CoA ligase subunit beta [Bacteroidales bacterium]HNW73294.1 ADP-forming succinate--CoA ligase subunit beta [Bacteroidales bacterium]HPS50373.1 ADP-forming succinate--CoA ligase subunit beta [Bacteroidales bacterium]